MNDNAISEALDTCPSSANRRFDLSGATQGETECAEDPQLRRRLELRDQQLVVVAAGEAIQDLEQLDILRIGEVEPYREYQRFVVFARVEGQPGTIARRLRDIENFEEVSAKRDVDRLFASGWLERAL